KLMRAFATLVFAQDCVIHAACIGTFGAINESRAMAA
ncbi:MAG: hypothetical protein ACI9HY_003963, partial [Planctomycetaceae bacterium]